MPKKAKAIPVNHFSDEHNAGISIERIVVKDLLALYAKDNNPYEEARQAHRHDCHSFFLLEKGAVSIEIDFKKYNIKASSVIYMHPNQVHRITASNNVTVTSLAITNENLNPAYLELLEAIMPAKPLTLKKEALSIMAEAASLCLKLAERRKDKLHHLLLKDSCNALVALVISQYIALAKSTEKLSRFETVTKAFKETLEANYIISKRPADYAKKLNLSTPYLNECVKHTTGHPVSYHIQQRVILEAKRLLYHSHQSVKEIAAALGYDDYPYFSRLFTKVSGVSALAFRNKNRD